MNMPTNFGSNWPSGSRESLRVVTTTDTKS